MEVTHGLVRFCFLCCCCFTVLTSVTSERLFLKIRTLNVKRIFFFALVYEFEKYGHRLIT